jgi:ectoine hydroxylase-related dioxygenase (phytanoyl-CoA dioxygenase family)
VRRFVTGRRRARIAAELMGTAGVRLYHDQALYKEPGGGPTPWHVDQHYWPLDRDQTCTAWIPLQPTAIEMGPLAFSAGSQALRRGREFEIGDEGERQVSKLLLEQQLPLDETPFALGEVSFHSGWTFHRAGPNRTGRPREAMTVIYMDIDTRIVAPAGKAQRADLERWCPGVQPGELAASPLNPVLYEATPVAAG